MLVEVIDMILWQGDTKKAENYIKGVVSELVQNRIDVSKLVITKAITKKTNDGDSDDNK
jgi:DNA polymerase delta subunit 1